MSTAFNNLNGDFCEIFLHNPSMQILFLQCCPILNRSLLTIPRHNKPILAQHLHFDTATESVRDSRQDRERENISPKSHSHRLRERSHYPSSPLRTHYSPFPLFETSFSRRPTLRHSCLTIACLLTPSSHVIALQSRSAVACAESSKSECRLSNIFRRSWVWVGTRARERGSHGERFSNLGFWDRNWV